MPAPLVLLANAQEWFSRSLESILRPAGYDVLKVYTARDALARARRGHPDAIVLDTELPETDAFAMCRVLRVDPAIPVSTPIVLTTPGPATRAQLIAALRAGANDVWGQPLDSEECLLRLEGYLRAKEDADHAREQSLVDEPTGFYNAHGLARRVRELAAAADRMARPLACLVVAPEPTVKAGERSVPGNGADPRVEALGRLLKAAGRTSDAIGRLGPREFVVLGLNTDADGALGLGERLGWAVRVAAREAGIPPLRLRAGCAAGAGFRASAVDPLELINRALGALREAERENGDTWLHRAEPPHPPTPPPPPAPAS